MIVQFVVWIGAELAQLKCLAEFLPQTVGDNTDENLLHIGRLENLVDGPGGNAHRHGLRRFAGDDLLRHVLANQIDRCFEQGAADALPSPGLMSLLQCGQNADHAKHPTRHVDHRRTRPQRSTRWTCHIGETAHHLRHLIERHAIFVGSAEETFLRAIDQARVFPLQRFIRESEFVQGAAAKILDQHVAARRKSSRQCQAARMLEIQTDALLGPVKHREIAGAGT